MKLASIAFACLLIMPACLGGLSQVPPERHVFALTAERSVEHPSEGVRTTPSAAVVDVRGFGISPRASGEAFVYRLDAERFEEDFYSRFLAPPAELVTDAVRGWLGASGRFASVLVPGSRQLPTHVLEGNVAALHGDFSSSPPAAVIALELFLLEVPGGGGVVWQERLERRIPLDERSARALVRGWNAGLLELLSELEEALADRLAG